MTLLLLNRRGNLCDVATWFSGEARDVIVLSSKDVAGKIDPDVFRHIEFLDHYESPFVEDAARRLYSTIGFDRIVSLAEGDVLRAALLREEFKLVGQGVKSGLAFRNKFVMKSYAAAAGVRTAPMQKVEGAFQLLSFARRVGYPLVLKQTCGAASIGMHIVVSDDEILGLLSGSVINSDYLAEGFVEGSMYHVDGLMADGVLLHGWPSRYLFPQWETMYLARPNISGMLGLEHPLHSRLLESTRAVIAALPPVVGVCAFHAEFFVADKDVVLCEIACRPGGAGIVDAYELAFSTNLSRESLRGQAGLPMKSIVQDPTMLLGWAYFPPRRGRLVRIPQTCTLPGVLAYKSLVAPGDFLEGPRFVTDHIAHMTFVVHLDDPSEELCNIATWWENEATWA